MGQLIMHFQGQETQIDAFEYVLMNIINICIQKGLCEIL